MHRHTKIQLLANLIQYSVTSDCDWWGQAILTSEGSKERREDRFVIFPNKEVFKRGARQAPPTSTTK
jgi:hypothetical protein